MINESGSRREFVTGTAALMAVALAGCEGGGGGRAATANAVLRVTTGAEGTFVANFNPFSPAALQPATGMVYEPLYYFNSVRAGEVQPWLGSSYRWSPDGRTLTIRIRPDVTWTDGQPFTAEDVAYTFDLGIKNTALNRFALPLKSATATARDTATLTFTEPSYSKIWFILCKQVIVPKHIFEQQRNLQNWANARPVGTGAFMVKQVAGQTMTLTANPRYYQRGLPKFKTIQYQAFNSNTSADAAITSGQIDWAGSFIPQIKQNYLARNPNFTLVNVPLATNFLVPNSKRGPTADVAVRKAISAALDRNFISQTVYDGEAPPTNPMALLRPNYEPVLDPTLANARFDTGRARVDAILTAAGYAKGAGGLYAKAGRPLSLTVKVISGYTDYVSALQIIKQQLNDAGIGLTVQGESFDLFTTHQSTGDFELLITNYGYTPSPYAYYSQLVDSRVAPALGEPDSVGNYGRYSNPRMDAALDRIAAMPNELDAKADFATVQRLFTQDMPLIPLFNAQNEIEFNGNRVAGFPTERNPFGTASVFIQPDNGWIAMRLTPVSK